MKKQSFNYGAVTLLLLVFVFLQIIAAAGKLQDPPQPPLAPLNTEKPNDSLIKITVIPEPSAPPKQTWSRQVHTSVVPGSPSKAAKGKYTIAWISDTQYYSESFPDTFLTMTRYLKNNQQALNLGYVAHTGDLVNDGTDSKQWRNAERAMKELSSIPHGVLAGNHDVGQGIDYTNYSANFGEQVFDGNEYYGESLLDNRCHYDLITMGSTDYVFVYLGYQPGKDSVSWANEVFAKFADRIGVLCVHEYMGSYSTLRDIGKVLKEEVVKTNPNVYLVLCGHRYNEDCVTADFDDDGDGKPDRTVYQCIANYQNIDKQGGSGYMRFIEIDEEKGTIHFYTYSPLLDQYRSAPENATNPVSTMPIPWK